MNSLGSDERAQGEEGDTRRMMRGMSERMKTARSRDFLDLHRRAPKIEGMASVGVREKSQEEGEMDDP